MTQDEHVLYRPEFPLSNSYDPDWVMENQMGPNALWLMEWLCKDLDLKAEMRILDLGCGTAMSSIFLARELGVQIWASDLWVNPDQNWRRVCDAGVADRVYPLRVEAHALPFAKEFFDAVVSVDSYHYFGTDTLYLGYLTRFVKPRGRIGVVIPGLTAPFTREIPHHLTQKQSNGTSFWEDECNSFLTKETWREIWEGSNRVEMVEADTMPDGWRHWRDFEIALEEAGKNRFASVAEALDEDQGRYLGFIRLVAKRKEGETPVNLYDPGLIASMMNDGS